MTASLEHGIREKDETRKGAGNGNRWRGVLLAAVLTAPLLWVFPKDVFWVRDCGNKFLITRGALLGRPDFRRLPYPGKSVDPEGEFFPVPEPFSRQTGGRRISQYPPVFPAASALFYLCFGFRGLYVLPWLCGLGLAAGMADAANGKRSVWRIAMRTLAVFAATPVLFYSYVFWEHNVALFLFFSGWVPFVCKKDRFRLSIGALLMAVAVVFREEAIIAVLATAAALGKKSEWKDRRFAIGVLLVSAAVSGAVAWTLSGTGEYPGGHYLGNLRYDLKGGIFAWFVSRGETFWNLLAAAGDSRAWNAAGAAVLGLVAVLFSSRNKMSCWGLVPAALFSAALVFMAVFTKNGGKFLLNANGLVWTWPLVFAVFFRDDPAFSEQTRSMLREMRRFVLFYFAGVVLTCPRVASFGMHWSARLLLFLVPAVMLVFGAHWRAARGNPHRTGRRRILVSMLVFSIAIQFFSLVRLWDRKQQNARLLDAVNSDPGFPIVTPVPWLAEDLAAVYEKREIFFLENSSQVSRLGRKLRRAGRNKVLIVVLDSRNVSKRCIRSPLGLMRRFDLGLTRVAE